MSLKITNIPAIMRSKGWKNGARLMEAWFSRPPATAPAYGSPETSIIKMDSWVLTFPRARQVFDQLVRERIWENPASQREISSMLRRKGFLKPGCWMFGQTPKSVDKQDPDYINFRIVDQSVVAELNDLSAALGNFVFRILVSGAVEENRGVFKVVLTEVGVYIRDSYDFNGSQHLGFWDDSDNSVSSWNALSGTAVSNEDFSNWRKLNHKGGDFLVFSDIKRIPLKPSFSFVAK